MERLWLIQPGSFREKGTRLIGKDGVVCLSYRSSAEFGFNEIPKAYRRLMYYYSEYEVFNTGIYTPEKNELMVFCRKSCSKEILESISRFIERPYRIKEYSELEKVPRAKEGDRTEFGRRSNFWWCIDNRKCGDWMAFLQPNTEPLTRAIKNEYQNWWLTMSPERRKKEYEESLR